MIEHEPYVDCLVLTEKQQLKPVLIPLIGLERVSQMTRYYVGKNQIVPGYIIKVTNEKDKPLMNVDAVDIYVPYSLGKYLEILGERNVY